MSLKYANFVKGESTKKEDVPKLYAVLAKRQYVMNVGKLGLIDITVVPLEVG